MPQKLKKLPVHKLKLYESLKLLETVMGSTYAPVHILRNLFCFFVSAKFYRKLKTCLYFGLDIYHKSYKKLQAQERFTKIKTKYKVKGMMKRKLSEKYVEYLKAQIDYLT